MSEEKKKTSRKKAAEKETAPKKVVKKKVVAAAVPSMPAVPAAPVGKKKVKKPFAPAIAKYYGTGRRKSAIAQVFIFEGSGKALLNSKPAEDYFCNRPRLLKEFNKPLILTNNSGKYDIAAHLKGGGVSAQADALRMAVSRALVVADPNLRKVLRTNDMLKRDPREKERKKYGLKRARRAFQYSKR